MALRTTLGGGVLLSRSCRPGHAQRRLARATQTDHPRPQLCKRLLRIHGHDAFTVGEGLNVEEQRPQRPRSGFGVFNVVHVAHVESPRI